MKSDTTTTVLTFVLGVLILLDVIFAWQSVMYTRQFRLLQFQALQDQATMTQLQQRAQQLDPLIKDVVAFNQKNPNPELTRILQSVPAKSPAK